jgi:ABC-type bacteriocin/lantibiotic exporter with double-glycine peptidase domain
VHHESHHVSVAQFSVRRMDSFATTEPSDAHMKVLLLFITWCVLFVLSWPIALVALIAAPIVWLLSLPLRLIGVCVESILALLRAVLLLPARVLGHRG